MALPLVGVEIPDGPGVLLAVPFALAGAYCGAFAGRLVRSRLG